MKSMFSVRNILPKANKKIKAKGRKDKIPLALRQQVWIHKFGRVFEAKCPVVWCTNPINVFDFESGHNIPESKGGETTIDNLLPICSRCNKGMGNRYTIDEWCEKFQTVSIQEPPQSSSSFFKRYLSCFERKNM